MLIRQRPFLKISQRTKFLVYQDVLEVKPGQHGVYAAQNIPKGAIVWAFDTVNCRRYQNIKASSWSILSFYRLSKKYIIENLDEDLLSQLENCIYEKSTDEVGT